MAGVKKTENQLDQQDSSDECLTTPPESVDDSSYTKVTDEDHQMPEVSGGSVVTDGRLKRPLLMHL